MNVTLDGKRALVTGGNSGIGKAVVLALADAGANVAINYLDHPEVAETMADQIRKRKGEALAVQADVSDPRSVEAMFDRMDERWGGIDILVGNAGIDGQRALGWQTEIDAWRRVIEVNLLGAFLCARQALRRMVPQKSGVILNVSSVHEIIAWSGYSAYTASKAGLSMMTRTLAQEAASHGVRVLAIGPGAIKTPINEAVWSQPSSLDDLLRKIPLRRLGEPEEIARLAVILVSDVASYMTGRTVFVDGGMTDYPDFAEGG